MWRVLSSKRFTVTLHEFETQWSIDDWYDALAVLDAYETAEIEANRPK